MDNRIIAAVVAVVLALIAVAALGPGITHAFSGNTASNVVTDISQLMTNARGQFMQNSNGYTNFTTANESYMINAGIFPSGMVRNNAVIDRWGNSVSLSSANNAVEGVITFGGGGTETADQCTTVVTNLTDYVQLVVGGKTFTQSTQPDSTSAGAVCSSTATIQVTFQ